MKKIAFYLISDGLGGAETVVKDLLLNLRQNFDLYLIVNNEIKKYFDKLLPEDKILYIGEQYPHLNPKYKPIRYFIHNRFFSVKQILLKSRTKKITQFIEHNNIQLIHCHLESSLYSCLKIKNQLNSLNIIYTVHSAFGLLENKKLKPQIHLKKLNFSRVSKIIFVSEFIKELYSKNKIEIDQNEIIYNGCPANNIQLSKNYVSTKSKKTILFLGGSKFVKGWDILIETIDLLVNKEKYSDFNVQVLGKVKSDSEFINQIKTRNLSEYFIFNGFIPPPENLTFYKIADLLFMPSRTEAMPMAAIEAIFFNVPIIATKTGGFPEIIDDNKNGYLCPLNPHEFSKKIFQILNNPEFRKKSKEINKRKKELFNIEKNLKSHINLYESFLNK